ncbi:MAG TPA: hypothetical protein VMA30_16985 [Xanthobacteraceae bacterium]|nr:hypothetical protein [Xanthobacteraceae bacterium]
MSWTYEIALRGAANHGALQTWFDGGARQAYSALPGLASFDLYTPDVGPSHDPYNNDGVGPQMLLMLDFVSRDALAAAAGRGTIAAPLREPPAGLAATGAAFARRFYPVGEGTQPAPLQAPFSYVVRYHHPADDVAAFIANYLATHPVTQARLPGIRSIMCYLPLDDIAASSLGHAGSGLKSANYMIGNEVVFDHIEAFNVAMASPVRQELRAHYHEFPRFTGANTHFPMTRRRLVG